MPPVVLNALCVFGGLLTGIGLMAVVTRRGTMEALRFRSAVLREAAEDADRIREETLLRTREDVAQMRREARDGIERNRQRMHRYKKRLFRVRAAYRAALEEIEETRRQLETSTAAAARRHDELAEERAEMCRRQQLLQEELARVAGMTPEEARRQLLNALREEVRAEAAWEIQRHRERATEIAAAEARRVIVEAVERCAAQRTAEHTVVIVPLADEQMKGRVIGREGRNIRAFESATGVDLLIDDQPDCIVLSAYDPVKREIARRALTQLIDEGRITPDNIDTVVRRQREALQQIMLAAAEEVIRDLDLAPPQPELLEYLGRLRFRTSYNQNVLYHCKEVALLTDYIAAELRLPYPSELCRRAGLFHDIGKAIDGTGAHTALGAELVVRCGEHELVREAIEGHHADRGECGILTSVVSAADAISGSRPGARRQTAAQYVDRLSTLEELASSFPGVERCYAVHAGREVRVIVRSGELDDRGARILAGDVAHRITDEMRFPGEIKVTVIRETRAVTYAH